MFVEITEALEIVLRLARESAKTPRELEAIATVEDMATNHFGDE